MATSWSAADRDGVTDERMSEEGEEGMGGRSWWQQTVRSNDPALLQPPHIPPRATHTSSTALMQPSFSGLLVTCAYLPHTTLPEGVTRPRSEQLT